LSFFHLEYSEPFPRVSDDLFEMFNLTSTAAEVAREKPNGEKNGLRKTYKGQLKRLGVVGHFDGVKAQKTGKPGDQGPPAMSLLEMISLPDDVWETHHVKNKELSDGLSDQVLGVLTKAMTMAKGSVPKSVWDSSVLGDLAPSNPSGVKQASSAKPTNPGTPAGSTPAAAPRPKQQVAPGQDPARPRRNIKKRSYGDSSFEGYGEGFPDDEGGADTGYSTEEGGGQKRRKKVCTSNSRPVRARLLTPCRTQRMRNPFQTLLTNPAMGRVW
jgi:hypothetical protein